MGVERVRLQLGQEEAKTGDLWSTTRVKVKRKEGKVTSDAVKSVRTTAFHEACHARAALLVGLGVIRATDIPTAEYGGATWTTGYEARMVAAPHALGCDGTGHDLATIEANGDSVPHALAGARKLLAGKRDELDAIATEIHKRGTASGAQMVHAKDRVVDDQVEVTLESRDGTTKRVTDRMINNVIEIPMED